MNQQMISIYPASDEKGNHRHSNNIMNVIRQYAYHWPLFCITILSSLALALIYLKTVAPVYEVKARLLIKDQIRGGSAEPALAELDFIRANHLVENELEILKSRALMENVVRHLEIWVTYKRMDKFLDRDIYKKSPVRLMLAQGDPNEITPRTLQVKILNSTQYAIVDDEKITRMNFSSRLKLGHNYYRLEPTGYLPAYAGSEISISIISPQAATGLYLSKLITSPVSKLASLVEISMRDDVPERGKDILNKLITEYNQASVEYKNRETQNTLKFMDARLDSLSDELGTLERNVAGFKSSRGLTEISEKSRLYLDNVRSNDEKLNEVNVQLEVIADLENYISSGNPEASPSTNGISDPNLASLLEQLTTLELQRDRLLATMPEKNPVVQAVDNQIKTLRVTIKENVRSIKASLMATRKQLRSYDSSFEASIRDIPVQERQYISIKREQSIKEDLYVYLLRKREEAALSYASTLADSRTVDQAFYNSPDSPKPPVIFGAAFLVGMAIPIGIIFCRQQLNSRIVSDSAIKEITAVPILAELVQAPTSQPLPLADNNSRILAEQFRILRTNLQYLHEHTEDGKVTMLTSGMAGEGKSFITSNLGLALARYDRKTIILEFDLRKPGISKNFRLASEKGISDFLTEDATVEEIVQPSNLHPNLYVIRAGRLIPNASDYLGSPRLKHLIELLRKHFDEILIDTPPIHLVSDAMIISKFSDVNLFVIRQAYTRRSELEYLKELHDKGYLKNLNIVFNGIEMGARYNYKAGFDYGYYTSEEKPALGLRLWNVTKRF